MKLIKSKKGLAFLATLVVAVVAAVGAYAYFTSTGNGTGSATVGDATNWTVGEDVDGASGGPLYPDAAIGGANIQTDSYTVKNGGSGSQNLTSVTVQVAESDGDAWSSQGDLSKPACTAADFSVGGADVGTTWTDPSTTLYGDYVAGESRPSSVTVELIDNSANQDNCQGVTVPLYFSAS
jgi:hypothetical protein